MLLSGHHPFYTPGMTSVFTTRVVDADFGLDAEEWAHTSDEAKVMYCRSLFFGCSRYLQIVP